jgi:hypothetical protein
MAEMGKSRRVLSLCVALVAGIVIASLAPQMAERVRQLFGRLPEPSVAAVRGQDLLQAQKANDNSEDQQLKLTLTPEQIAAAGIEVQAVGNGVLAWHHCSKRRPCCARFSQTIRDRGRSAEEAW